MEQAATVALEAGEDSLEESRPDLGELFDALQPRLYRLARRLSRDPEEARDLVQETFLRLARARSTALLDAERAEGWLVRILVNLCRDRQRRLKVRREHAAQATHIDPGFESAAIARATVEEALARLPARRRAVVILHELEERSAAEVGTLLGMAQVTVRWHLHAARRQLRRILGANEGARP